MLTSRTPLPKPRKSRWEKDLRSAWQKGFLMGAILLLAVFSHTASEYLLAIFWYFVG